MLIHDLSHKGRGNSYRLSNTYSLIKREKSRMVKIPLPLWERVPRRGG
jgi:hypothetical protein